MIDEGGERRDEGVASATNNTQRLRRCVLKSRGRVAVSELYYLNNALWQWMTHNAMTGSPREGVEVERVEVENRIDGSV